MGLSLVPLCVVVLMVDVRSVPVYQKKKKKKPTGFEAGLTDKSRHVDHITLIGLLHSKCFIISFHKCFIIHNFLNTIIGYKFPLIVLNILSQTGWQFNWIPS